MDNQYDKIKEEMHNLVENLSQKLQYGHVSIKELNDAFQNIDSLTDKIAKTKTLHDTLHKRIYPTIYHLTEKLVITHDEETKRNASNTIAELEDIFNSIIDNIEDTAVTEELIKDLESISSKYNQTHDASEDAYIKLKQAEIDEFFASPESKFEINTNGETDLATAFGEIDNFFEREEAKAKPQTNTSFSTIIGLGITVGVIVGVVVALYKKFKHH